MNVVPIKIDQHRHYFQISSFFFCSLIAYAANFYSPYT